VEVSRVQFIPSAQPRLRASPPIGDGWQYEVKFDGYRVQLHKVGASSMITVGIAAISAPLPGNRRGRPWAPDKILRN
jgi:hypothetical protein